MKLKTLITAVALATTTLCALAHDAVEVQNAWARATVKGQMATGAFMTLTAKDGAKLVGASSPVAGVSQVHEMKMDGGVMKMAELKGGLELPAGKAVELKPGGYHVMLMDLKEPLMKDSSVPVTLIFKDAKGVESKQELKMPVAMSAPAGMGKPAAMDHSMHNMHGDKPAAKP
ncbi:copper chaperone PCu(A)C [Rhodoferax sp.]|uniref:copper chaperone PCu(A)C n=1 Tax=Rhodoferax sp. TaxID=50421 RepID=UPI002613237F|nr:copper chaperone PCu(A)C [Rhodoferax sp.]MDD2810958.1 copper chaperone PCu(A)C [Rhodoferax sp.]MDD4942413.1 copper chaperone PCu(A)C [Rhodoferax sp.]MDD5479561.1 copper chaperone PCu(A)C [Rhodoferax sp.]